MTFKERNCVDLVAKGVDFHKNKEYEKAMQHLHQALKIGTGKLYINNFVGNLACLPFQCILLF